MVNESSARNRIVEVGRHLWQRGLVAANDGNISVRLAGDRVVITPTGVSKGDMSPADLVVVDLGGEVISPTGRKLRPTSELPMHLEIYSRRQDVEAVVHAHPPVATAFAASGLSLKECFLAETALLLGEVPLAPYAAPSTAEVPASIRDLVCCCDAILLSNHGAVTYGSTLKEAHFKMETLEHSAKVTFYARQLGQPAPLTKSQLEELARLKETTYGLQTKTPGVVSGRGEACARTEGSRDVEDLVQQAVEVVLSRMSS